MSTSNITFFLLIINRVQDVINQSPFPAVKYSWLLASNKEKRALPKESYIITNKIVKKEERYASKPKAEVKKIQIESNDDKMDVDEEPSKLLSKTKSPKKQENQNKNQ